MSTTADLAGNRSDSVIYQEEFFAGMFEQIQQEIEAFNGASNGSMVLRPRFIKGDFEQESFFTDVEGMIQDRDPDSNTAVDDIGMQMDELIRVKVNKRIGPMADSIDRFRKIGEDPSLQSFILGQQWGPKVVQDYVNTGILSLSTGIESQGALTHDATADGDMDSVNPLIRGNALLGDKAQRIRAYVMHSKVFHDLMAGQASGGFTNVADVIIYGGTPGTLGKPIVVTDSEDLVEDVSGGEPNYITLGLTDNGLEIAVSEGERLFSQPVLGQENIIVRWQAEYAYNVGIKGFAYTGAAKATRATLGSTANWEFRFFDKKLGPGVRILTK